VGNWKGQLRSNIRIFKQNSFFAKLKTINSGTSKKAGTDKTFPCMLQPELTDVQFRKNWSRLIQNLPG